MTEAEEKAIRRERIKNGLQKLGRTAVQIGLPTIGAAVGGPAGGRIAAAVAGALGLPGTAPHDEVAEALAKSDPDTLFRLRELEYQAQIKLLDSDIAFGQQVTDRAIADVSGDSWLAKNIRPMIAGVAMLAMIGTWIYFIINLATLDAEQLKFGFALQGSLSAVTGYVVQFYFGSRKEEKLQSLSQYYNHIAR